MGMCIRADVGGGDGAGEWAMIDGRRSMVDGSGWRWLTTCLINKPPPKASSSSAAYSLARSSYGGRAMGTAISCSFGIEQAQHMLDSEPEPPRTHARQLAEHTRDYQAACSKLRARGLGVCCDGFATGECKHGTRCECGWLRAPWPWTHYQPGGVFCDCHRDSRAQCLVIMYLDDECGFAESSVLWPGRGPYRGSGLAIARAVSMSSYSDDIG